MTKHDTGQHHERENEREPAPAGKKSGGPSSEGATARDLEGISAVPTEGEKHGKGGGAHSKPTPGDEVDPGVG